MSRSGYTDDYGDDDPLAMGRYRAAVRSAMNGKRGQALLRELVVALDAMPEKRLASSSFVRAGGEVCALGAVAVARGIDVSDLEGTDQEVYGEDVDAEAVGERFNIAESMAREIMFMNDEVMTDDHDRFRYVRDWASRALLSRIEGSDE